MAEEKGGIHVCFPSVPLTEEDKILSTKILDHYIANYERQIKNSEPEA